MKIINTIKNNVILGVSKIEIKDQISGLNHVYINIIDYKGQSISLGKIPESVKIRVQPLGSDVNGFFEQDGRVDNCHRNVLHQHSEGSVYPVNTNTLSGALSMILGNQDGWSLGSNNSS